MFFAHLVCMCLPVCVSLEQRGHRLCQLVQIERSILVRVHAVEFTFGTFLVHTLHKSLRFFPINNFIFIFIS